ncbi:hypothetical protein CDD83_8911 [Cordyceps sp. RAO-2017]|nr:hypothetical protein CDD83_8911 [Cordyceps sp. RAO-2017]
MDADAAAKRKISVSQQEFPGKEQAMPQPRPMRDELPEGDGGRSVYRAADKLRGRKAVVTGGDIGIGAATAVLFAREGADSTIAYLPDEKRERDSAERDAADQMMVEDVADLPEDQWVHTFNTNIHSFFYMSKYALAHMKRGSTIINNASIHAYVGRPDLLDYTSTKGAVVSFTRGLGNQYLSKGIRVNAVAPGPVWTPLIPTTMNEGAQKEFTSFMGRPAQPSEVASCVVFLASSDSSCVSAQTIHCNGGVVVNG